MALLEVRDLKTYYSTLRGEVRAVDGVSLEIERGEALGLVGESGCGKSTIALSVMRLLPWNGRIVGGRISLGGVDVLGLDEATLRAKYRWKRVSMIFQGAMNALHPLFKIGDQIAEGITTHEDVGKEEAWRRARELLSLVGVGEQRASSYPHELSGGMKQRTMIAMALACNPDLVIADEPTTALDVIVQGQVLKLMKRLQGELNLSMMFITHDLSVIAETCDRAVIMYAGKVCEAADIVTIFKKAVHPYTQGLVEAFPSIRGERKGLISIPGSPPDLLNPPPGCRFHTRCPHAEAVCREREPELISLGEAHFAACHLLT
ncbi:MAG: ABC transporter ATP-binding protein [Candidatus Geothermarchaeales archaeon]